MNFLTTLARENHVCPRCGEREGDPCRTPSGRKASSTHGERVRMLTPKERATCGLHRFIGRLGDTP